MEENNEVEQDMPEYNNSTNTGDLYSTDVPSPESENGDYNYRDDVFDNEDDIISEDDNESDSNSTDTVDKELNNDNTSTDVFNDDNIY